VVEPGACRSSRGGRSPKAGRTRGRHDPGEAEPVRPAERRHPQREPEQHSSSREVRHEPEVARTCSRRHNRRRSRWISCHPSSRGERTLTIDELPTDLQHVLRGDPVQPPERLLPCLVVAFRSALSRARRGPRARRRIASSTGKQPGEHDDEERDAGLRSWAPPSSFR
jgi:hypothetical protein